MFGICASAKEKFKRSFLRDITYNATYNEDYDCEKLGDYFCNMFNDVLPVVDEIKNIKYTLDSDVTNEGKQINLRSKDASASIKVSPKDCTYKITRGFEKTSKEYNEIFSRALNYLSVCGVHKLNRLSLRKINVLQFSMRSNNGKPMPLLHPVCDALSDVLLMPYDNNTEVFKHARQSMQTLLLEDSGYVLALKYGIQIIKKENDGCLVEGLVVLDLEISKSNMPISDASVELNLMSDELYNAFVWALSEKMKKVLRDEQ